MEIEVFWKKFMNQEVFVHTPTQEQFDMFKKLCNEREIATEFKELDIGIKFKHCKEKTVLIFNRVGNDPFKFVVFYLLGYEEFVQFANIDNLDNEDSLKVVEFIDVFSSNYNAKIVCTNPKASKVFEKGKVYDVVNGFIYHKGKLIMQPRVFENFEELHDHAIADFVELIDE
ncbi:MULTISPECIES: hypothetical protein [Bacillota]|uniref:Uncharacterized protein n=1 Tax=[Eubacterium] hominis TaxID=2764325 RepID=A0A7G9GLR5_9FIRM|nr:MULTISPECIES: hypothetical protein [Bacillota]QNM11747.1 hypothetical protein H9Q80_16090 [[Eubacterium] hominis]RGB56035.1 hypothetical protein DW271_07435 [Absiella sp. AM22-9]RGB61796.1 hypothetical protein DW120_05480 [Absiella sp. AM10-20]RGB70383.1 hypothetical protein DW113_01235 [Absiella sp. AM09-45]RGB78685.1 hypothetical protein DW114_02580 [Absiella sp. AM09-50]